VFSGGNGVIFAITDAGELFYYKYLGMATGANSWGNSHMQIGNGWNFRHVFSSGDGVLYGITDTGDLLYFKYLGMNNGSRTWGKVNVPIGSGWIFRHVFAGDAGVIFAVNDAGVLFYYKYLGMSTGAATWGPVGKQIGSGWVIDHVFAEFPSRPADPTPRREQLPPSEDPKCASYASAAVSDFKATLNSPKCRVSPADGRWSADYKAHYNWCMAAPQAARVNESTIRDKHLLACGARSSM